MYNSGPQLISKTPTKMSGFVLEEEKFCSVCYLQNVTKIRKTIAKSIKYIIVLLKTLFLLKTGSCNTEKEFLLKIVPPPNINNTRKQQVLLSS